ncbi:MAG: MFS transporter [Proteobacteria bacterium]|nr:MFS transporter [Pseudomonadota bacterium]MDA1057511.1 MFS transporter [Pseudomonadota bacterium]
MNQSLSRLPLPWLIWGLAAAFYGYAYFQRVAPSVMTAELMRDFSTSAAGLGNLSAYYFYPYALAQIPIGMLIDRFGVRRVLLVSGVVCAVGSILFAVAPTLGLAATGRLLVGAASGVAWVGTLALAVMWLPANRFAAVTGLSLLVGLVGAVLAQAPLAALVDSVGWRPAMLWSGILMAAIAVLMFPIIRDKAMHNEPRIAGSIFGGLALVFRNAQTWKVAIFTGSLVTPMAAFAGLFGVPYVQEIYGVSRTTAGATVSLILIGWGVGGPVAGWLSDRLQRRKPVMATGAGILVLAWLAILLVPVPLGIFQALLLLQGLASGAVIINFAITKESNVPTATGVAMGFTNMAGMTASAASLPLVGWLLDLGWDGTIIEGARVYGTVAYRNAFTIFPVLMMCGFVAALTLRETFCRPLARDS